MANEGLSRTPEYISWNAMRRRCLRPHDINYKYYGGRGITICERWLGEEGFANFLADMGPRPDGTSLDRIDSNGNYKPDNCRWADKHTQATNRRNPDPAVLSERLRGNNYASFRTEEGKKRSEECKKKIVDALTGRVNYGSRSPLLNETKVREIRNKNASGIGTRKLAEEYGINRKTIVAIIRRETWKEVE